MKLFKLYYGSQFKIPAILVVVAGILFFVANSTGIMQTKNYALLAELIILFGSFVFIFTKEKDEKAEDNFNSTRFKAFAFSVVVTIATIISFGITAFIAKFDTISIHALLTIGLIFVSAYAIVFNLLMITRIAEKIEAVQNSNKTQKIVFLIIYILVIVIALFIISALKQ